jgi:hypothetical protein
VRSCTAPSVGFWMERNFVGVPDVASSTTRNGRERKSGSDHDPTSSSCRVNGQFSMVSMSGISRNITRRLLESMAKGTRLQALHSDDAGFAITLNAFLSAFFWRAKQ